MVANGFVISFFDERLLQLSLNPSRSDLGRREKINLNFYFHIFGGASKGFTKALKAFIKLFEAPQRSAKIKIQVNIYLNITF